MITYFWNVVSNRKDHCDWQKILLDGEVLEGVYNGKVPLQSDRHGHVDRPGSCNVKSTMHKRYQVNGNILPIPKYKSNQTSITKGTFLIKD